MILWYPLPHHSRNVPLIYWAHPKVCLPKRHWASLTLLAAPICLREKCQFLSWSIKITSQTKSNKPLFTYLNSSSSKRTPALAMFCFPTWNSSGWGLDVSVQTGMRCRRGSSHSWRSTRQKALAILWVLRPQKVVVGGMGVETSWILNHNWEKFLQAPPTPHKVV